MIAGYAQGLILLFLALAACAEPDRTIAARNEAAAPAGHARIEDLRRRLETPRADDVMVVAHRACWKEAPENSVAAIQDCIEMGVDMVEIDVQATADGQLVLMHDDTVDRTTNGSGRVRDLTLAELKTLFLRDGIGGSDAALTTHRIPTLEEALDAAEGQILVNLDAKGEVLLHGLVEALKLGRTDHILFKGSGLSQQDLAFFKDSYFMPIVRDGEGPVRDLIDHYDVVNPVAVEMVYQDPAFLDDYAQTIAAAGKRIWANTMWEGLAGQNTDSAALTDPDTHWGYLVSRGVNMIQTDEPRSLLDYLKDRNLR